METKRTAFPRCVFYGSRKMLEVVAAVVRKDGKILICQRPAQKSQGLLWEFAGGKVEPGESKEAALRREFREELGVELPVRKPCVELTHEYPSVTVHLTAFEAELLSGTPVLLEHRDMRWISPGEVDAYEFCPADLPIAEYVKHHLS